jgi:hypothetical protein
MSFKDKFNNHDLTNIDNYEQDYEMPWSDRVEKIYEIPEKDDMAGVFIRGNFKNERQLNAAVRLYKRHVMFGDTVNQEVLRIKIAGTPAIGGVRSLEALFAATNLIAADMYRVARGMPKVKGDKEERVVRGSDFRETEKGTDNKGM